MTARKETISKPTPDAGATALSAAPGAQLTGQSVSRLRAVAHAYGDLKDKRVSGRVSGKLLAAVKHHLGVTSDTEAIEIALANMAITDDFGTWLVDQAGQLDPDFELEL